MNRRRFLSATLPAAAAFAMSGSRLRAAGTRVEKPNLLFLWTDQQRADTLRRYNPRTRVQAPNLDKLAGQSVAFTQAYVTQPVCTPSRSSVMTGLWPHQNGCTRNNVALEPRTRCFPELLADPDYRTGYIGKWHLGDELFAQHGFEEWAATEDGYTGSFSSGRDRNARSAYYHYLVERGYRPDDERGWFTREYALKLPVELGKPAFQAERATDFLRRQRTSPFILHVNYLEPHTPYLSPLHDRYLDYPMEPDPSYHQKNDPDFPFRYRLKQQGYALNPKFNSEARAREIRRHYCGNISAVDRSVGIILDEVERLGLAQNTIVVFTSDHGDQMSAHRLWEKDVMLQESLRVPYMIRLPGARDGRVVKEPVSHIDIVPTLLELMGGRSPGELPGQSLADVLRDKAPAPAREVAFAQWNRARATDEAPKGARFAALASDPALLKAANESTRAAISPDGWKLCLSDHDKCQLYHLREDPGESANLYYRGGHRDVIARLARAIDEWQERTQDRLALG